MPSYFSQLLTATSRQLHMTGRKEPLSVCIAEGLYEVSTFMQQGQKVGRFVPRFKSLLLTLMRSCSAGQNLSLNHVVEAFAFCLFPLQHLTHYTAVHFRYRVLALKSLLFCALLSFSGSRFSVISDIVAFAFVTDI